MRAHAALILHRPCPFIREGPSASPAPPGHVLHHRKLDVEPDRVAADAAGVAEKLALHGHPHAAAALRLAQAALQTVRPSTGCSGTVVSWLCCIRHISCALSEPSPKHLLSVVDLNAALTPWHVHRRRRPGRRGLLSSHPTEPSPFSSASQGRPPLRSTYPHTLRYNLSATLLISKTPTYQPLPDNPQLHLHALKEP